MVKKLFALLLVLAVVVTSAMTASAFIEMPKIDTPYGIMYRVYDDTQAERVSVSCCFTDEYAAFSGMSNEESQQKYGFVNAYTYVQIDYRIDGGEWHETPDWRTSPANAHYGGSVSGGDTVRTFDLLYLINDVDIQNAGALAIKDDMGRNVFDLDNHTLEFRMRTVMTYTDSEVHTAVSDWSEVVKVERNKDFGKAPEKLDVPVVYNPHIAYFDETQMPYLSFDIKTPESIKKAEAWLSTQEPTYIELCVEINKGDGVWEETALFASSGHYVNETKAVSLMPTDVADSTDMKLRLRYRAYIKDTVLHSEYSDVLEFSVPRWEEGKGVLPSKCQVCGICDGMLFGNCIFVALGIVLLVAVIVAVPAKMHIDKQKAKKAADEKERQRKIKEEREAYDKSKQDKKNKNKKG